MAGGEYRCIVCSRPIGREGFLETIKGISVVFCRKHARSAPTVRAAYRCPASSGKDIKAGNIMK